MNKQTAVDWLVDQMFKQGYFDGNKPLSITNLDHLQQQAKAMEREQIEEAYGHGSNNGYMYAMEKNIIISRERYYNETYKGGVNE